MLDLCTVDNDTDMSTPPAQPSVSGSGRLYAPGARNASTSCAFNPTALLLHTFSVRHTRHE